jgi:hypothetical protein
MDWTRNANTNGDKITEAALNYEVRDREVYDTQERKGWISELPEQVALSYNAKQSREENGTKSQTVHHKCYQVSLQSQKFVTFRVLNCLGCFTRPIN